MFTRRFGRDLSNVNTTNNTKPAAKKSACNFAHQAPIGVNPSQRVNTKTSVFNRAPSVFDTRYVQPEQNVMTIVDSDDDECDAMSIDVNNISLEDIDEYDTCDPQFVSEYINDIMNYLKEKEKEVHIAADYCEFQKEIQPCHRDQIIRWIAEIYVQLNLLSETYFLAVNIVDQVLAAGTVTRKKLQLIALTSVLIASKYEETWATPVSDLIIICDKLYTEADILRMEQVILNRIDFNLCIPAPIHFLRRYSKAGHSDGQTHTIAKYLCEATCLFYDMLPFLPSQIAASAVYLSRQVKQISPLWNSNLTHYSGYTKEELIPCMKVMVKLMRNENKRAATGRSAPITRKYSEKKFLQASRIVANAIGE